MASFDLPPAPGTPAVLGWDGVERPVWLTGSPGQIMVWGANGPAFVDRAVACAADEPVAPPALRQKPPTMRGTRRATKGKPPRKGG